MERLGGRIELMRGEMILHLEQQCISTSDPVSLNAHPLASFVCLISINSDTLKSFGYCLS